MENALAAGPNRLAGHGRPGPWAVGLLAALGLLLGSAPGQAQIFPRIVNGVETQTQPATGALLVPFGSGHTTICTGTLIGCQTFLTAAHCVCPGDTFCTPNPSSYAIFLQHSGIHSVTAIDVHPDYDFAVEADVAVVTLGAATSGVPPVPLNASGTPAFGTSGTIVGFGITSGSSDDSGLLREGLVTTDSCSGLVPAPAHVCWTFQAPVGPPGQDSNTCSGDSGGPLFVDFGAGPVVAGITSGGISSSCLATDRSFDANVYQYGSFITGIGGADLANTTCGPHSQVGEPATTTTAWSRQGLPGADERSCRVEVHRQMRRYAKKRHIQLGRCIDSVLLGKKAGPCPDATTAARLADAAAQVDPVRLDQRCPPGVLAGSGFAGACATAQDGSELAACIVATVDSAIDTALDVAYADPGASGPLADTDEASCQRTIGRELIRYTHNRVTRLTACAKRADLGKVAACPDAATTTKIARDADKAQDRIPKRCSDAQVAALDAGAGFGGSCAGATTTASLAACGLLEHDTAGDTLLALVEPATDGADVRSFTVPAGSDRFRVTLNGIDAGSNDIDLYVKFGSPPTTTDFDLSSAESGVFEFVEQGSPTAGEWYVLVHEYSGSSVEYQATATVFQP